MAAGEGGGTRAEEGTPGHCPPSRGARTVGLLQPRSPRLQPDGRGRTGKTKPSDETFLPAARGEEPSGGLASPWCLSAGSGLLVGSTHRNRLLWGTSEVTG